MAVERAASRRDDPLRGRRRRADYNAAERRFSIVLQQRLQDLLQASRNTLELLRQYPNQPGRLGIMGTPPGLPREQLRLHVVEQLIWDAIGFVREDGVGGPVSQSLAPDGSVVELQTFSTKYPHIIIERTDRYVGDGTDPVEISWSLRRVQNQRYQTQLNRLFDVANLALEMLRVIR